MFSARALHYVLKIGDRAKNAYFFREILGMKVLRHEEFKEGCDAQCNGPYDNRWSKTMVGYGPESTHFVIELTYNYGIKEYELGNDFGGITIRSARLIDQIKQKNYPYIEQDDGIQLKTPDGYTFNVINRSEMNGEDPVIKTTINVTDLEKSINYWSNILTMKQIDRSEDRSVLLGYGEKQCNLELVKLNVPINRGKAFGRIAFAVPLNEQERIDKVIKDNGQPILTPLITLDTPGKATVRVIILADPDGHEICFVDEEGFSQLSAIDRWVIQI